ncbi:hypothetical protein J3E72DRAFT_310004, partial [Bipolaris maydis]|uniref:uncharacterized protein n=1 Tax=Cochliobolus heterostrophus TaxID=5016 RepID=UPI0024DC341A
MAYLGSWLRYLLFPGRSSFLQCILVIHLTTASGLKNSIANFVGGGIRVFFFFWCFSFFESLLLFYPFLVQNLLLTI